MQIKKLGHCCLLIKTNNLTVLTDPGAFSNTQNFERGIDVILITHEHMDHFHVESLKEVLNKNPNAQVVTNSGVGKKLDEIGIPYTRLEGKDSMEIQQVLFEAFDGKHEEIFEEFGQVQNTGYFIDNKLFYPGDSFHIPGKPVDILALPVAGPWCKVGDAVRYALAVNPKKAFPVHDGMLVKERIGSSHIAPQQALAEKGIEFVIIKEGEEIEL